MKIRVQRKDGLWEVLDLPSKGTEVLDLEGERNCVFAGTVNFYFDQDGYFECAGRSLESMASTHSVEAAESQINQIESGRQFQDVLDADEIG